MKEQLKKYQQNQLTPAEMEDFEKNIINQGFDYLDRRAAWQQLMDKAETPIVKLRPRFWTYGVAASLAALIAFGLWYALKPSNIGESSNKIALLASSEQADYYLNEGKSAILLGDTKKGENDFMPWEEVFKKQDFKAVAQFLENKKDKSNRENYYLAWAYASQNKNKEAQDFFKIATLQDGQYSKDALWYAALIALKSGQKEAARQDLLRISQDKADAHSEKAAEILKKL